MGEIARISKCYAVWSTTSPALLLDTALLVDAGDVIRDVVVVRSEDGVASFA